MNDQDYIRAGVDLAPVIGWVHIDDSIFFHGVPEKPINPNNCPQWFLDALAAQLERQYQESSRKSGHNLRWSNYVTEMRRQNLKTDLTMWKLKYIVDSKVLVK